MTDAHLRNKFKLVQSVEVTPFVIQRTCVLEVVKPFRQARHFTKLIPNPLYLQTIQFPVAAAGKKLNMYIICKPNFRSNNASTYIRHDNKSLSMPLFVLRIVWSKTLRNKALYLKFTCKAVLLI